MSENIPCSRSRPDQHATWVDAAAAQTVLCRSLAADKVNNTRRGPAKRQFGKDSDFDDVEKDPSRKHKSELIVQEKLESGFFAT